VSAKYLLPCPCGRQMVIERCQAGESIPCSCGAQLEIPTLLGMADLEPAPADPIARPAKSEWGLKQAIGLLGIMVALLGIAAGVTGFYWGQPKSQFHAVDLEQIRLSAQKLTPSQTWDYWESMQQGLDRRIDEKYAEAVRRYYLRQGFLGILTLIGIAIAIATAIGSKGRESETSD
jgi:hypothetical protein